MHHGDCNGLENCKMGIMNNSLFLVLQAFKEKLLQGVAPPGCPSGRASVKARHLFSDKSELKMSYSNFKSLSLNKSSKFDFDPFMNHGNPRKHQNEPLVVRYQIMAINCLFYKS